MEDEDEYEKRRLARVKKYNDERLWKYKKQNFSVFSRANYYLSLISDSDYLSYIYRGKAPENVRPVMTRSEQGNGWTVFCRNNNYVPSHSHIEEVMEADMETTFRISEQESDDFHRMQNGHDILLPEPPHDLYDAEDEGWAYPDNDSDPNWALK